MKDDKKKLIVVVALALVIVAVGVFQFTAGGSAEPAPLAKKEEKKAAPIEVVEPPKNPMFAMNLAPRDPFKQVVAISEPEPEPQQPTPPPVREAPPMPPPTSFSPIDKSGDFNPVAPLKVEPPEPQFQYRLSGVMLGAKPMAVFTDPQGNQRLILLGGALEPECNVLSISKDAVAVRFHGKTLRLTVEGNPNDK